MRYPLLCIIALSVVGLGGCASHTSTLPVTPLSQSSRDARPSLASPHSPVPLHIHGAMAWYQGHNLNTDISGTWMAQHYDITEQGDAGTAYANSFIAAGGKYAMLYSDPEIVPFCNAPFATANGAKPGTCTGPLSAALNGVETAWLHDKLGNRLHVTAYGTQTQGNWQDRVNPRYSPLPSVYQSRENGVLTGSRWNALEIDDFQSGYLTWYFNYKYGTTAHEFDIDTNANADWLAAQERIVAAAPKPVSMW